MSEQGKDAVCLPGYICLISSDEWLWDQGEKDETEQNAEGSACEDIGWVMLSGSDAQQADS